VPNDGMRSRCCSPSFAQDMHCPCQSPCYRHHVATAPCARLFTCLLQGMVHCGRTRAIPNEMTSMCCMRAAPSMTPNTRALKQCLVMHAGAHVPAVEAASHSSVSWSPRAAAQVVSHAWRSHVCAHMQAGQLETRPALHLILRFMTDGGLGDWHTPWLPSPAMCL